MPLKWSGQIREVAISDRVPVAVWLGTAELRSARGRLKPGPVWAKPAEVSAEEWRSCLDHQWMWLTQHDADYASLSAAMSQTREDIQGSWDLFMAVLNRTDHKLASTWLKLPVLRLLDWSVKLGCNRTVANVLGKDMLRAGKRSTRLPTLQVTSNVEKKNGNSTEDWLVSMKPKSVCSCASKPLGKTILGNSMLSLPNSGKMLKRPQEFNWC